MQYTKNYNFNMPDQNDKVNIADLNENMENLDEILSKMSPSGGGTQSDYTMNDSTDPSYIKNREFYTSEEVTKYDGRYVVVTQDILDSSMEGISFSISDKSIGLVEGQTYTVKFNDGVSVSGTAVNVSEMLSIDTVGIVNTDVEPYYYVVDKCKLQVAGSDVAFVKDDNSVLYYYGTGFTVGSTIQITGDGIEDTEITQTTVHKLPEKYLTQSDWSISDTNSAAYVKNRPLYSEVLNGRGITFTSDDLINGMYGSLPHIGLVAGETYTLVWNDIEYSNVYAITNEDYPDAVILLCPDSSGPQICDGLTVKDEASVEDATKALVILGSEALPIGTKISVYGKTLTAPTSPQTITTTAGVGTYHATYGNSLGLVEGNSYTLTINGSEYTYTAENLRKNSAYTSYLSKDVIGIKVSDFNDMVILDQYKLPSDSLLTESDFINGTVDSNVCSVYYYTGITISIAGEFAPPSFENFHKIDENYLPEIIDKKHLPEIPTCERIAIPSGFSFTDDSGATDKIVNATTSVSNDTVNIEFSIYTHNRSLDSSGNAIVGSPLFEPEINIKKDSKGCIQCLDKILDICVYNYQSGIGDIKLKDILGYALTSEKGATALSYHEVWSLGGYVNLTLKMSAKFESADVATEANTYLTGTLLPALTKCELGIYRLSLPYTNSTATIVS